MQSYSIRKRPISYRIAVVPQMADSISYHVICVMYRFTGHEPYQLVRHHSRAAIRVVHSAVLRASARPACAGSATRERDGRPATAAERLPFLPGMYGFNVMFFHKKVSYNVLLLLLI